MLHIYVSTHCSGCAVALRHGQRMQARYPDLPLRIVNVDSEKAAVPEHVIGTPVYAWNDRILFLGYPSETKLAELVRTLHENRS